MSTYDYFLSHVAHCGRLKARVNMNLSEILECLKGDWKGKKVMEDVCNNFQLQILILQQNQIFKISYFQKFY